MTNLKKSLSLCLLIIVAFFMNSCAKDDNIETTFDSNLVQQRLGKELDDKDYMIINHIGKDNEIAVELLKNINFNVEELNIEEITRADYGWNDYFVFEIPFKNNDNKRLSIFNIEGKFLTTIVEITKLNENRNLVQVNSLENEPLYRFEMLDEQTFENFIDIDFGNFYVQEISSNGHRYDRMEDCGKYEFGECMVCGLDVCAQDWRCQVASAAMGPAFVAGLAITCGLRQLTRSLESN